MAKTMPRQRPSTSEQSVGTPKVFTDAVLRLLGVDRFAVDLAASHDNAVCEPYFTKETDSFLQPWGEWCNGRKGWGWLNPPFSEIGPWVSKAAHESMMHGAQLAMLVPAATDTKWWIDGVHGDAYVVMIRGRFAFAGHTDQYPKGLALLLYAPYLRGGYMVWDWKATAAQSEATR